MRRLANDLGVQPGALYYHVASKQDLVAAAGEHILAAAGPSPPILRQAAKELRALLLDVRDGAEVISFVYAYRPAALAPFAHLGETLIRYVLGFVAVEQNRAELIRARIVKPHRLRTSLPRRSASDPSRIGSDRIGSDRRMSDAEG